MSRFAKLITIVALVVIVIALNVLMFISARSSDCARNGGVLVQGLGWQLACVPQKVYE